LEVGGEGYVVLDLGLAVIAKGVAKVETEHSWWNLIADAETGDTSHRCFQKLKPAFNKLLQAFEEAILPLLPPGPDLRFLQYISIWNLPGTPAKSLHIDGAVTHSYNNANLDEYFRRNEVFLRAGHFPPCSFLIALEECHINIVPRSHTRFWAAYDEKSPPAYFPLQARRVKLFPGEVCMFRHDVAHGGSEYTGGPCLRVH
jgi:hypothetical protein